MAVIWKGGAVKETLGAIALSEFPLTFLIAGQHPVNVKVIMCEVWGGGTDKVEK